MAIFVALLEYFMAFGFSSMYFPFEIAHASDLPWLPGPPDWIISSNSGMLGSTLAFLTPRLEDHSEFTHARFYIISLDIPLGHSVRIHACSDHLWLS